MTRHVAIIGSGFGGLALALRLQAGGVQTTVFEAGAQPGGRASRWERDGYHFDAGPTVITDPGCLRELWALTGDRLDDDVTLLPVDPFYRLSWPDGSTFDYGNDDIRLAAQIAAFDPADVAGYERFLGYAGGVFEAGYRRLGAEPFLDFASMLRAAPALARHQAWRSVYDIVASFIRDERLRQALSFHTLLVGGNPMTTSSIYALIHHLERSGGVWFARGGTHALVRAMAHRFRKLGGVLRLGEPVRDIRVAGGRIAGVATARGAEDFDAVVSNADVVATYRMIRDHARGPRETARLTRARFSPSLFLVHIGARGRWPDVPHHSVLFGPRYGELLDDIYRRGVVPDDPALYVHHPTATDPSLSPPGCTTLYALAPVPHLGHGNGDWDARAPAYREHLIDLLEQRLLPGLRSRIDVCFHYTPLDFQRDLGAHLGSAFSLEPLLRQSAYFRVHNRDDVLPNLYFVGAGTHPGAGIPGVVGSAKATAGLVLADLAREAVA